jgi:hypothetical protein
MYYAYTLSVLTQVEFSRTPDGYVIFDKKMLGKMRTRNCGSGIEIKRGIWDKM